MYLPWKGFLHNVIGHVPVAFSEVIGIEGTNERDLRFDVSLFVAGQVGQRDGQIGVGGQAAGAGAACPYEGRLPPRQG